MLLLFHIQLFKERLEHYKPGRVIPYISIGLRLIDCTNAQPLTETVTFTGIKPKQSIEISRIPQQAALAAGLFLKLILSSISRFFHLNYSYDIII